ncbi:MAG: metallophosphoesterase, partial [Planctomycetaceae bacterium]|nr:metallophosphoesterase [Planctomycetaceae bacterium]
AFVSGEKDDENTKRLVVGRNQMLPPNDYGVTNMVICHHPLDWLLDRDALRDNLKARASIALFGHKHAQRVERADDTLFVSAGAVHPDRNEGKWEPRYNFLSLSVVTEGGQRSLAVELWPRIWDDVAKVFKAEHDKGWDRREFRLPLPAWQPPLNTEVETDAVPGGTKEVTGEGKILNPKRRLVYRFHALPYIRRLEVLTKLKLVAEGDQDLREEERNPLYFRRAEENGILAQLWTAVEQQHGVDLPGENPFLRKS